MLDWAGTRTVRLFGLHPSSEHAAVYTEDELRRLVDVSRRSGHLRAEEQQLINRVFDFQDAEVREAMVPRTQVEALPVTATLEEARAAFRALGYSRLPVYRDRLDEIVGVLFRKDMDMGQVLPDEFDMERLLRAPVFVPATSTLGAALAQMQGSRTHLAFAIDEHGGLEGVITLEDLLEEIVGEIDDEFDEETRSQIVEQADGTFLLDGMLAVRDANRRFRLGLPEDGRYTTLAGFLLDRAGQLLKTGDAVVHEGARFLVERVERRRVRWVRFQPAAEKQKGDGDGARPSTLLPLVGGAATYFAEGGAAALGSHALLLV
jgi:CBS domain containing-hemolysin-like protein